MLVLGMNGSRPGDCPDFRGAVRENGTVPLVLVNAWKQRLSTAILLLACLGTVLVNPYGIELPRAWLLVPYVVLFGGFAFSVKDRDGYQTNQYDGSEWADSDVQAFRGTLLWTPTEDLTLKVVADHSDDQSKPNIPNRVALNVAGINGISTPVTLANTIYGPGTAPFDGASDVSLPPDEDTVNTAHVVNGYDQTELKTSSVAGTITWAWVLSIPWLSSQTP